MNIFCTCADFACVFYPPTLKPNLPNHFYKVLFFVHNSWLGIGLGTFKFPNPFLTFLTLF